MADYRRFISYMYLYENGRKTVNSGFVRVESRNGQCRIHVHMAGLYGPEGEKNIVYMLIRDVDSYIGIAAGILRNGQQTGELDMLTDSDHLAGTNYGLDKVSGMVVLSDSGRIYGTRWDDEPLETEYFVSKEQLYDGVMRFPEKVKEAGREKEQEQNGEPVPGSMVTRSLAEFNIENNEENRPEKIKENNEENRPEAIHEIVEENGSEDVKEIIDGNSTAQEIKPEKSDIYEALMERFPRMYPFDDNSIESCVRLDLQDIGMLPMQCWLYGSNSFLLHGYYCYRHLILARMQISLDEEHKEKKVYILGVPGTWQHREQYMAFMFGFRNFKPVSRENSGNGAFGYWFVNLK